MKGNRRFSSLFVSQFSRLGPSLRFRGAGSLKPRSKMEASRPFQKAFICLQTRRADLLIMPNDLLQHLLEICEHAERMEEWPFPAMTPVVTALEKISRCRQGQSVSTHSRRVPGLQSVGEYPSQADSGPSGAVSPCIHVWNGTRPLCSVGLVLPATCH